jgi:hypothetical protein
VQNIKELTSRISSRDIPKNLDQLEVPFKARFDATEGRYVTDWQEGDTRAIDVVLATNMLSVGVDVNRLGLMAVNGQPKGTAEYIQSTSRVGRQFPGLVCTVLTWARPRDLSHYETFEHYHATFYKHVEAQSVTPFSPRAIDRGLTGSMLSLMRLDSEELNPNTGAMAMDRANSPEAKEATEIFANRAWNVTDRSEIESLTRQAMKARMDEWAKEAGIGGRVLGYEKRGAKKDTMVPYIKAPGHKAWDSRTAPMSMREVEPGVRLVMNTRKLADSPNWRPRPVVTENDQASSQSSKGNDQKPKTAASPVDLVTAVVDIAGGKYAVGDQVMIVVDGQPKTLAVVGDPAQNPTKNSFVVLTGPSDQQGSFPKGIFAGKLSWSRLQDEHGNPMTRVKLRCSGSNVSFDLPNGDWASVTIHAQEH